MIQERVNYNANTNKKNKLILYHDLIEIQSILIKIKNKLSNK